MVIAIFEMRRKIAIFLLELFERKCREYRKMREKKMQKTKHPFAFSKSFLGNELLMNVMDFDGQSVVECLVED